MLGNALGEALERMKLVLIEAQKAIESAGSSDDLDRVRVQHTGKRAALTQVMQVMPQLEPTDRKQLGAEVNATKQAIEDAWRARFDGLRQREQEKRLDEERVDVTLPGIAYHLGYEHPLLRSIREILAILRQLGFAVFEGPEVESERYNFDMLNMPKYHPARDKQDTFWVTGDMLLRTQTSPAQIRYMLAHPALAGVPSGPHPAIRVAAPGWCYRNETEDASHGDRFYQIEGLAVDTDITLADLKGTLTEIATRFFGADRRVRFRPSFFPFTEPSAELDIECAICRGRGCRSCSNEGWLELGGSGMVHPKVLAACGYDPERVSGFAFGIGPDRYTMMKYGVTDLRLFREDDLRFLRQLS